MSKSKANFKDPSLEFKEKIPKSNFYRHLGSKILVNKDASANDEKPISLDPLNTVKNKYKRTDLIQNSSVMFPVLSNSPQNKVSHKFIKDDELGLQQVSNQKVKIIPMRKENETLFEPPKANHYKNMKINNGFKITNSLDTNNLIEVLNQHTSKMLFNFEEPNR